MRFVQHKPCPCGLPIVGFAKAEPLWERSSFPVNGDTVYVKASDEGELLHEGGLSCMVASVSEFVELAAEVPS